MLPGPVMDALRQRLRDPAGFRSYGEIQAWVQQQHGHLIKYTTLYRIVHDELKAKPKVPRPTHIKNAAAGAAFVQGLAEQLKAVAQPSAGQPVRVFVQDESRFGLLPMTRRPITARGVKPIQPVQHVFQSCYLYGSVEPASGDGFFSELPSLNADGFQIYLNEFSHQYPDQFIIMLVDNSGAHTAKRLVTPANLLLLFFPAYCPELNPMERFWEDLKGKVAGTLFDTVQMLQLGVADHLNRYTPSPIASLTGYPYLINAINANSMEMV